MPTQASEASETLGCCSDQQHATDVQASAKAVLRLDMGKVDQCEVQECKTGGPEAGAVHSASLRSARESRRRGEDYGRCDVPQPGLGAERAR
eukprot:559562-Amphidinium_carterae.1